MDTLIRNATLLTVDGPDGLTARLGDLHVAQGRIAALGPGLGDVPGAQVIDGRGKLLMPGLVNGHLHSGETFFKGRYQGLPLELWMLYAYPIVLGPAVPPRLLYLRTALMAMEALKGGTTTVTDDFIDRPFQDLDRLGTVFSAYGDTGIRATVSNSVADLNVFDTVPFARALVPAELQGRNNRPPVSTQAYLDFCRGAFAGLHGRYGGRLRFMIAPSAPQRCSPELLQACSALASEHGVPLHTHVLETRTQAVTAQMNYGRTLVEHMARLGVLTRNLCAAHAIWLTDHDIALLGEAGCSIVHNTLSNLKLGSGVARVRALLDAGVNVALGTDGVCSNDTGRMFDVVRAAGTLHNLSDRDHTRWLTAGEVLQAATLGGARSAMLENVTGSLAVGKRADLLCLDLRAPNFFPLNRIDHQLVHCENGSSIAWVMVDGEVVVRNGRLTQVDEDQLLAEAAELLPAYLRDHGMTEQANSAYHPHFVEILRRCGQVPLASGL